MYTCADCQKHSCFRGKLEDAPLNCPCRNEEIIQKSKEEYQKSEIATIAYCASLVETENYCKNTRLEEIMNFSQKCGYHKLGLAFCIGLYPEAKMTSSILKNNGFEVESIICKNGAISKEFLGISEKDKLKPGNFEAICNPIGQAMFLNHAETQLNVLLGLCVGHDTMFIKYSNAPVTVFAVKDRALAHNPLGALYLSETYYNNKLNQYIENSN